MLNTKSGVSIYIAVMIMAILLAIVLGLNATLVAQIKTIRNMGYSVVAFYAAETGIEAALFDPSCQTACELHIDLDLGGGNRSHYDVYRLSPGNNPLGDCAGTYYCLQSVGIFQGTRRAIQVSR